MKREFRRIMALFLVICMVISLLCLDTGVVRGEGTTSTVSVILYVGETTTITDESGNYASSYTGSGLDTSIATVSVTGSDVAASNITTYYGESQSTAASGSTYYVGDGTNYLVLNGSTLSTTTDITQATAFTWTETTGRDATRYLSYGSYYLRYNNGTWSATTSQYNATNFSSYSGDLSYSSGGGLGGPTTTSTNYALYNMAYNTVSVEESHTTSITFTGVSVGTTSVTVGNTLYNIRVTAAPATYTGSVSITGGGNTTVSLSDLNSSYSLSAGQYVEWSVADSTIADVYSSGDTGTSIIGHKQGTTTVTATVYNEDGSVAAIYTWTVNVTSTSSSTGDNTITLDATVTVTNGRIYYSVTGTTVQEATLVSETIDAYGNTVRVYSIDTTAYYNKAAILCFFVAPDDGYVLTSISDDGSTYGQYYTLDKTDYTVNTSQTHQGGTLENYMTNAEIKAMVAQAVSYGCEVIYWNTVSANFTTTYSNYCNKLPTVDKEITSVTHNCDASGNVETYKEGETTIEVGDVITYTITITTYYENVDITYSGITLTDTMTATSKPSWTEQTLASTDLGTGTTQTTTSETKTYTVTYTVQSADINEEIVNTAALSYTYYTSYEEGAYSSEATAECAVTVTSFYPKGLVLDYGLPMEIDYSTSHGYGTLKSGTASFGDISIENNVVTYTPKSILTGVDTVTLTASNGGKEVNYTFNVYPATTVYYEEGFATYGTGWSVDKTNTDTTWSTYNNKGASTSTQEAHIANDSSSTTYNNYGYDGAYTDDSKGSEGTAASTSTVGASLQFTFTGTGVDLFANCDSGSGMVAIQVVNNDKSTTTVEKFLFVDMANTGEYSTSSNSSGGTAYNTPIASISGLDYGSHTVTIYLVTASTSGFQFDGFRVYDTIKQDTDETTSAGKIQTTVYENDDEDYPVYYELRNAVLYGLSVNTSSSTYADDLKAGLAQVYASSETGSGALVVYDSTATSNTLTTSEVQSLLDNGPKNELYLPAGATVVFKVTTLREVQVGLRSVTGASVDYSITVTESGSTTSTTNSYNITSSVDMFYDLVSKNTTATTAPTYIITITNTNTSGTAGILSVTDIKISDSTDSVVFGELTTDEIVAALVASRQPAQAWSVSATLSEAAAAAAEKISAAAYKVLELVFNRTYTGNVTFSVADFAGSLTGGNFTGNKVLLLQPSSADPENYVLAGESMADEDGNVTFTIADSTDGILVGGTNGDVNGDGTVNASDTLAILRGVSGRTTLTAVQSGFADVNLDGTVNSNDLLAVVKYVSGRIGSLN